MGQNMLKGESGRDLFNFAQRIAGKLPGGLAVAATVASAIFAAISGSSTATAATIGAISTPEMIDRRSEEHTSELQSLMRISYAVFCLKKKTKHQKSKDNIQLQ